MSQKIIVIGSINMDLVTSALVFPKAGETLIGTSFLTIPGGKGANQAVAAARLGADVSLIGCVGDDLFGKELVDHLKEQQVSLPNVEPVTHTKTGIASITLAEGDNSIIVVPGANYHVTPELVAKYEELIASCDTMLLQLEIPMESVEMAVKIGRKHGLTIILNPAPIAKLSKEILLNIDYITPNEHEVFELLEDLTEEQINKLKEKLIVTKGAKGITYYRNGNEHHIDSYPVEVVDTTGAGDSFNGALAVALTAGNSMEEACRFANAVGALAVTKLGAQSGMPTKEEVEVFLNSKRG
ncbi:ribokinase [Schinkia azotoformans MEV2011]|uniref:Ribokinase n=1 Tax=Schinkia azotoformans MEV2011 TaxID=1348973 RepID=A0A072NS77_SCHAZ|nr:ribokinase [Schinkia azotoformans]KEF39743.1 ribokinase [Schinkia azotoformans MEV2011]MEC1695039.1 ribokinase [Schinkia azotoformans]MEC1726844.1 ribokinase [Schinkia azotoformans]